ncbi:MAG: DNA repair protein RecO [Spirochaetales bacterium]|nr:DNA repair protein RecO [Spirochaetales bacterium]
MGNRFIELPGIVLNSRRFGEINKSVELLTPSHGILNVVAHGATKTKSKLAAASDLFVSGKFQLYHNPVKDDWSIKSVSNLVQIEMIRNNVKVYALTGLCSEIIRYTYAGGVADKVFKLFDVWLRLLERGPSLLELQVCQFILRFLAFAGFYHGSQDCSICGDSIQTAAYLTQDFSIVCKGCNHIGTYYLEREILDYIDYSLRFKLVDAYKIELEQDKVMKLFDILVSLLEDFTNRKFSFLEYYKTVRN